MKTKHLWSKCRLRVKSSINNYTYLFPLSLSLKHCFKYNSPPTMHHRNMCWSKAFHGKFIRDSNFSFHCKTTKILKTDFQSKTTLEEIFTYFGFSRYPLLHCLVCNNHISHELLHLAPICFNVTPPSGVSLSDTINKNIALYCKPSNGQFIKLFFFS